MKARTYRLKTRILSLILTLLIIFYAVPATVFAEMLTPGTDEAQSTSNSAEIANLGREPEIFEIEELREENSKQFRLEDGTYLAASYADPVHYLDGDGKWQDIDNRLFSSGAEYSTINAKIKFSKKVTGNENLFTLHDGEAKIEMGLVGAIKKTEGKVVADYSTDEKETTTLGKLTNLEKLTSVIVYENILDGVDLEYVVKSNYIKENIIVKERKGVYSYTFNINLNNLTAELKENGSVEIIDKNGETSYIIPAPIVYDSNGDMAKKEDATFLLQSTKNGSYTLTVAVSDEWMNAEDRAFPVTVDPTIAPENSSVVDLYVDENNPGVNYNSSTSLYVSSDRMAYWRTNLLPSLPKGVYISKATLTMRMISGAGNYIGAYAITSDWSSNLTWLDRGQVTFSSSIEDHQLTSSAVDYTWNVSQAVKQWYSGTPNYGIGFRTLSGSASGAVSQFYSNESTSSGYRPSLRIYYVDSMGLEEYLSYASQSVGNAGSGSVNLASGNLVFAINTLSTTDYLMTTTPALVYNSALSGVEYSSSNLLTARNTSYTPLGFKLNLGETVVEQTLKTGNDSTEKYYVYADADGTYHYFTQYNGVWTDEDGLGLEFTLSSDGLTINIKDKNKTQKRFTKYSSSNGTGWYLSRITDKVGNSVNISMSSSRPGGVTLAPINEYSASMLDITYNSGGKLSCIKNNTSGEAVVLKYSDTYNGAVSTTATKYLRQIIYAVRTGESSTNWSDFCSTGNTSYLYIYDSEPNRIILNYAYDSEGRLVEAEDTMTGAKVEYTYQGSRVVAVTEYGKSGALGQKISFEYGDGYTRLRASGPNDIYGDSDDSFTVFILDGRGRVISYYSTDAEGSLITDAKIGKYETQSNIINNVKETTDVGGAFTNYLLNGDFEDWPTSGAPTHWNKTSDVSKGYSSSALDSYYASISGSDTSVERLYQYVYLPAGDYTLSLETNSTKLEALYVKVTSLTSGNLICSKQLGTDNSYETNYITESISFSVSDLVYGGEDVCVSIEADGAGNTGYQSVTVDDIFLTKSISQAAYNMVEAGHFETTGINASAHIVTPISDLWTLGDAEVVETDDPFDKVLRITGQVTAAKEAKQRIYSASADYLAKYDYYPIDFASNVDVEYVVSGFGYASDTISSGADFGIRIDVYYYQGEGNSEVKVSHLFEFEPIKGCWQFMAETFSGEYIPAAGDTADYSCIRYIDVACVLSGQPSGYVCFDNISVADRTQYDGYDYEYYENGLLKSKKTFFSGEFYKYDTNKNLTQLANNTGELYKYEYNNKNQIIREIKHRFVNSQGSKIYPDYLANPDLDLTLTPITVTVYEYTAQGLLSSSTTSRALQDADGVYGDSAIVRYDYRYSDVPAIFGAPTYEDDNINRPVLHFYNEENGRLLATVRDGYGTAYSYTTLGKLKEAIPATGNEMTPDREASYTPVYDAEKVSYSYNSNGELSSITVGNTTYRFSYDSFGNSSAASVGNTTIASYEYYPNNGKLKKVTYGNGYYEEYVYNELEMLSEIWYNKNGTRECAVRYSYTADGSLAKREDLSSGRATVYVYDTAGRVTEIGEYDISSGRYYRGETLVYNKDGRLSVSSYKLDYTQSSGVNYGTVTNNYQYNENGSLTTYDTRLSSRLGVTYSYDALERLYQSNYQVSGGFKNTVTYEYRTSPHNSSYLSSFVSKYTSVVGRTSTTTTVYDYTYDERGNITGITVGGQQITYEYDDLGQLVRENNQPRGETYVYVYDNAGNLFAKRTYPYTTSQNPSSFISANVGTFGNSAWGDQLTKYKGVQITYDAIGNPLSYYNGTSYTFTWSGRQLKTAVKGGVNYSFEYDSDGLRTKKTVGTTNYTYYYADGKLLGQEWGANLIVF
ncbi:MAG: RHS repeat protein, partial [Clostridia bacterium]|nr:RHS repeat protein [Clostridia bacterium]